MTRDQDPPPPYESVALMARPINRNLPRGELDDLDDTESSDATQDDNFEANFQCVWDPTSRKRGRSKSNPRATKKLECDVDPQKLFLIHSIFVTILNILVMFVCAQYHYGLVIIPLAYNAILLYAAIWKNSYALLTIALLAMLNIVICGCMFVIAPALAGWSNRTVIGAVFGGCVAEIVVFIFTCIWFTQLFLVALMNLKKRRQTAANPV